MKAKFLILIILFITASSGNAQSLGDYKSKVDKFGTKNFEDANKRIYINQFNVFYQVYNERIDFKQGGSRIGGGVKGDATAQLAVGLDGVSEADLVGTTDKLFQDFKSQLAAQGFTFVEASEAGKTEVYADWAKDTGGTLRQSTIPGVIQVAPTGFDFYYKTNNKGEEKRKGAFAMLSQNSNTNKLSDELGDAIIANVNLYVIFTEEGGSWSPTGAKIKIKPNLRIVDYYAVVNKKEKSGFIQLKGAQTQDNVNSSVTFSSGKKGMNPNATYNGTLKKPIEINDVLDETKLVTQATQKIDAVGKENAYYIVYSAEAKNVNDMKTLIVNGKEYAEGVYMAGKKMIDDHLQGFLSSF